MPPPKIHLRPATPTDLPQMITLLLAAFSHGPWFDVLFPSSLRSSSNKPQQSPHNAPPTFSPCSPGTNNNNSNNKYADQIAWRTRILTAQLTNPGHRHVLAVLKTKNENRSHTTTATTTTPTPTTNTVKSDQDAEAPTVAGEEKKQAEETVIVGWAHWYLAAHDPLTTLSPADRKHHTEHTIWGTPTPPGLDKTALAQMTQQGEAVEQLVEPHLPQRSSSSSPSPSPSRDDAVELHYLMVHPEHQRKGIGALLLREGLRWVSEEKWDDAAAGAGTGAVTGAGAGSSAPGTRNVYLRSTVEGRGLYLAHGFREVGEGTVFGVGQFAMVKTN